MASFENSVVVAKNVNFDLAAAKPHLGIINAQGKLPIGTGNSYPTPEILGGNITSPDGSITVGYNSPNITLSATSTNNTVIKGPVVNFLATGNTNIFTFPTRFVLTGMAFLNVTLTGSVNGDGVANLGWTAANYTDIVGGIASSTYPTGALFEAGGFLPSGINNFMMIPAATTVVLRIVSADTGPSVYTNRVDLYGYYY